MASITLSMYERPNGPLGIYANGDLGGKAPTECTWRGRDGKQKVLKVKRFEVIIEVENPDEKEGKDLVTQDELDTRPGS